MIGYILYKRYIYYTPQLGVVLLIPAFAIQVFLIKEINYFCEIPHLWIGLFQLNELIVFSIGEMLFVVKTSNLCQL